MTWAEAAVQIAKALGGAACFVAFLWMIVKLSK